MMASPKYTPKHSNSKKIDNTIMASLLIFPSNELNVVKFILGGQEGVKYLINGS